jgi:phage shock protein PspC (stress-responsive transcriptional regulator)
MNRSFTNRVFGGVCGGLAVSLHMNAWTLRVIFVVLSVISTGSVALIYIALWWTLPQESLIIDNKRNIFLFLWTILVVVVLSVTWIGHITGELVGPTGRDLYWPVVLVVMSVVFSLRQVRGERQ